MCYELIKEIYRTSKEYNVKKVKVITNRIKICGELCECEDIEKLGSSLILKNTKVWLLDDLCKCGEEACSCTSPHIINLEWLHVNPAKIVAFSLLQ